MTWKLRNILVSNSFPFELKMKSGFSVFRSKQELKYQFYNKVYIAWYNKMMCRVLDEAGKLNISLYRTNIFAWIPIRFILFVFVKRECNDQVETYLKFKWYQSGFRFHASYCWCKSFCLLSPLYQNDILGGYVLHISLTGLVDSQVYIFRYYTIWK